MEVSISTIGQHRNSPRVWLEGRLLESSGFGPKSRYEVKSRHGGIMLVKSDAGVRMVSARKRGEREIPIIDINSAEVLAMFAGLTHVRVVFKAEEIHILPLATEIRAKERLERTEGRMEKGEALAVGITIEELHAKLLGPKPAYMLVMKDDDEDLHLYAHASREQAEEDRFNFADRGRNRTGQIVEVAPVLQVLGKRFNATAEALVQSANTLEVADRPLVMDDDEDEAAY